MQEITWARLMELEPGLAAIFKRAADIKDDKSTASFCANKAWYGQWVRNEAAPYGYEFQYGLKRELKKLVGWVSINKDHPILGIPEAYSLAYQKIYGALPDCRNCGCFFIE